MSAEVKTLLGPAMVGRSCVVNRRDHDWDFAFGPGVSLVISCPWRLVSRDSILLTDSDDEQWFGLPAPVNAEARANALLQDESVQGIEVDGITADLLIRFSDGLRLDVFNNSSGYEGWQAHLQGSLEDGTKVSAVIAMGGGGFSMVG